MSGRLDDPGATHGAADEVLNGGPMGVVIGGNSEGLMGLFDRFRKPKPSVPLPQLCYDVAYFVLPHYAYGEIAKVADLCSNTPTAAGPFFYLMACQMRKVEPVIEDAKRFHWHHGRLREGHEYYVLEYPSPPPVDLSRLSPDELLNAGSPPVLAPYFSAIIHEAPAGAVSYYILGQAPIGGGTTLRSVLREGANCNLGPGPEPRLDSFLEAISARVVADA
jgi:hypothetical protein